MRTSASVSTTASDAQHRTMNMSIAAQALRLSRVEAEDFLYRQAEFIDTRDFASWIDLFTPDGTYWIPARPGDTDPKAQLSFLFDDVPSMSARSFSLEISPNWIDCVGQACEQAGSSPIFMRS